MCIIGKTKWPQTARHPLTRLPLWAGIQEGERFNRERRRLLTKHNIRHIVQIQNLDTQNNIYTTLNCRGRGTHIRVNVGKQQLFSKTLHSQQSATQDYFTACVTCPQNIITLVSRQICRCSYRTQRCLHWIEAKIYSSGVRLETPWSTVTLNIWSVWMK